MVVAMLAEVAGRMVPPPFFPSSSSFFFFSPPPKSLSSCLHPSLGGLIGCEVAFLPPVSSSPPPAQGLPPKMVGSGAGEAAPPGPGGGLSIKLGVRRAGSRPPLRSARLGSARPAPALASPGRGGSARGCGRRELGGLTWAGPRAAAGPFKAASPRCVCVSVCVCV